MASIRSVLSEKTGEKKKSSEQIIEFAIRLHDAVFDLDDEVWNGLPEAAQIWVNDMTKSIEKRGEAGPQADGLLEQLDLPLETAEAEEEQDVEEEPDLEEEGDEQDVEEEPEPVAPVRKAKAPPPSKAKPSPAKDKEVPTTTKMKKKPPLKTPAAKPKPVSKTALEAALMNSARSKIREFVLRNAKISVDEIIEKLAPLGFTPSRDTVHGIKSDTRHCLKVQKVLGINALKVEL